MTRKQLILGLITLGVLVLLIRPEILAAVFTLIFLGMVPGTTYSVPSVVMFAIYAVVAILVIAWLARQPMYIGNQARQEKTARALARKKVLNKKKATPTKRRSRKTARA